MGSKHLKYRLAKNKKAKAEIDGTVPSQVFQPRLELRRKISVVLLHLLAVVLLTVSFAPFDCWYLAYIALVPWAMTFISSQRSKWTLFCGWAAGLVFWAVNLYWLWWITLLGYSIGIFYLSLYWLVAAFLLRAAMRKGIPTWISLPVIWVALEFVRGHFISFPWFFLAHSQYEQVRLIQISDVTGQYGVSFFVAMVNGAVTDLLVSPLFVKKESTSRLNRQIVVGLVACLVMAVVMVGYGTFRVNQSKETTEPGPVVGIVQEAFPISLAGRYDPPGVIFDAHVKASEVFLGKDVDLVIWPETMLPVGMNPEFVTVDVANLHGDELRSIAQNFFGQQVWQKTNSDDLIRMNLRPFIVGGQTPRGKREVGALGFAKKLGELSKRLECPILAGGSCLHKNPKSVYPQDRWVMTNSAIIFDQSWRASDEYRKVHLVPFSEYVPLKYSWLEMHKFLRSFVPTVMNQLEPGEDFSRLKFKRGEKNWNISAPICFEGTFARLCRKMVMDRGIKKVDILANLSNDGWFVYKSDNWIHRSTEYSQHLTPYVFRAIENRVPVVRAVNTGISASINSNGRIESKIEKGGKDVMISGTLLLDGKASQDKENLPGHGLQVLVDRRVSLYSIAGDLFAWVVGIAAIVLSLISLRENHPECVNVEVQ